ncbi:MAG TPA: hypothetical protein VGJ21_01210 [Terracidiphilus sp.]|jgi:hypothetical protein
MSIDRPPSPVSLLVITGTMGVGKSAVLAEASDLLAMGGIVHAAIDLDAFGLAHLSAPAVNDDAMYANLRSVCSNFAQRGVSRFVVARAVENRSEVEIILKAANAQSALICRLTSSPECLNQRVRSRETGILREQFILRSTELSRILDRAALEDFAISNEDRPLTAVAHELLIRSGWIAE